MRIKIGDLLVKAGVITELQLKAALAEQGQWGGKLGDILVRMEFVTEEVLVRALSKQTGIPRADLGGEPDRNALAKIAPDMAEEFGVVPVALTDEGRALVVAMSDPNNVHVTDHLQSVTGCRIVPRLAGPSAMRSAISRWYRGEELREEITDPNARLQIVSNSGDNVEMQAPRVGRPTKPPPVQQPPQAEPDGDPSATMQFATPAQQPAQARSRPPPQQQQQQVLSTPPRRQGASASEVLKGVEETQRRSVAALKAMVELLIEKGVFSRDEYLSRVRR
jgi:hypothetical protein